MKTSEKCREVPLDEARVGLWVKFNLTEPVKDDDGVVQFQPGVHVGRLARIEFNDSAIDSLAGFLSALAYDEPSLGIKDKEGYVWPFLYHVDGQIKVDGRVTDLHVYQQEPNKPEDTVEPEEPANSKDARIEDIQPGDYVSFGSDLATVTGVVETVVKDMGDGHFVKVKDLGIPYLLGGDNGYELRSCYRPKHEEELPTEPGFYKARTGSVWKFDGRLWTPILDHEGNPAPAYPAPTRKPKQFKQSSVKMNRFPFTRVEVTFE
ncbi:hypothetical protein BW14_07125 [Bifidobacterium sp. UTBIF-68]|uniref:hypothetical protein n=1 Tax=Bifidobacterium sp. UTBIF-68 TaxID=1465262 RepID=UPI00112D5B22|nr:hypothetical protein [Bifidobacterium sp. UTBIF-68]TPF92926.1 hypothetical protein BW14_07125 [Bifidobacterium sp. UTBIF-68]